MLHGEIPNATILNQEGERPVLGPVSIRGFSVIVDLPARGHRLDRGMMSVTAIPDIAVYTAWVIITN